jgi:hypothetical protein
MEGFVYNINNIFKKKFFIYTNKNKFIKEDFF